MKSLQYFRILNEKLKYSKDELTARFDKLYIENQKTNLVKGGLADNRNPQDFDDGQLKSGTKVEFEHTDDIKLAMEIAMDHLEEDPDYYKKLKNCVEDD